MRSCDHLKDRETVKDIFLTANEPTGIQEEFARTTRILHADYHAANLDEVVNRTNTINLEQKEQFKSLLYKYEHLFDGTLGEVTLPPMSIKLKDKNVKPVHQRPYSVAHSVSSDKLRREIDRMVEIGVLEEDHESPWAFPSSAVPKKNQTICVVSDFCKLNDLIERHPFPIPCINAMIRDIEGFTYATVLDLNMGYYHIQLDPDAQKLCTIIFPWGKYKYLRMPMGIKITPDIFQH